MSVFLDPAVQALPEYTLKQVRDAVAGMWPHNEVTHVVVRLNEVLVVRAARITALTAERDAYRAQLERDRDAFTSINQQLTALRGALEDSIK